LYGTVVHHGSGLGGHYTCFVKVQEKWYKCDDAKVTEAKEGYIDENAYLLFYKKIDF
jgi:ubiquitin carboxyl-terminal hydrolase 22/27/51